VTIKEVIFLPRKEVTKVVASYLSNTPPGPVTNLYYAAINIHDPEIPPDKYPKGIAYEITLGIHNVQEHQLWSFRKHSPNLGKIIFMTDNQAMKVIFFMDEIHRSAQNFILFINSEQGKNRSASLARFLYAIAPDIKVTGISCVSTDWHNRIISAQLAKCYQMMFQLLKEKRLTDEKSYTRPNPEPIVRREKDNAGI
jgi:hypothetical protein